jgi:hypothetical protein
MASTRNRNTPGDYSQFLKQNEQSDKWMLYENGAAGNAYDTKLPGTGLNPAQIPWNKLSNNAVDIESFLFGTNSTNLVNPAPPLTPELKCLGTANVFNKEPVYIPEPLVVSKSQRPFPLP